MKIKWIAGIITAALLLFALLQVPVPLRSPAVLKAPAGDDTVSLKAEKITVKGIGKAVLDSVQIDFKGTQWFVRQITVSASLLKLNEIRQNEQEFRRHLKRLELDTLSNLLFSGGMCSVSCADLSGGTAAVRLGSAQMHLKKTWGTVSGTITADSASFFGKTVKDQKCAVTIRKEIVTAKVNGKAAGGSVKGSAEFSLSSKKLHSLSFKAKDLEIAELTPHALSGTLSAEFSGSAKDSADLAGKGSVTVKEFTDMNSALLENLRESLSMVGVKSVQFDAVTASVSLAENKAAVDTLFADGKNFDASAKGTVNMKDLSYRLNVSGYLSSAMEKEVSEVIWGGLYPDPQSGGKKFGGTVRGVKEDYRVTVDRQIIRRSARSFFRNIFN